MRKVPVGVGRKGEVRQIDDSRIIFQVLIEVFCGLPVLLGGNLAGERVSECKWKTLQKEHEDNGDEGQ